MSTLAERIKSRRIELGWSTGETARKCGVSKVSIENWENGLYVERGVTVAEIKFWH